MAKCVGHPSLSSAQIGGPLLQTLRRLGWEVPTAWHYARYNGTAPIQASSGPTNPQRLNPYGNRQLNHALHMAAATQVRNVTPGQAPTSRPSDPEADLVRTDCRRLGSVVA